MKKLLLLCAALLLLQPLALQNAAAQGPDDTTLVIGLSLDSPSLDPSDIRSTTTYSVMLHLFGHLYDVTPTGELVPYFATGVEYSEDGAELTFTLHEGLTCHDGEPLTAEDVAYTFNRAVDPELGLVGTSTVLASEGFQEVRVDDELVLTVALAAYSPTALGSLALLPIHCKDYYEGLTLEQAATTPVGSGPYRFVEWQRDNYLLMERVEGFTLKQPH